MAVARDIGEESNDDDGDAQHRRGEHDCQKLSSEGEKRDDKYGPLVSEFHVH